MKDFKSPSGAPLIDIPINSKSFCVIDLDYLAFKVSSVLEDRYIEAYDSQGALLGKFKNRTDYKKSPLFVEEYTIKDCQDLKRNSSDTMSFLVRKHVEDIKKATNTKDVVFANGGSTNFRDSLPLPQKYKGNREGLLRPLLLEECKQFIRHSYPFVTGENMEADDIISMFQFRSYYDKEHKIIVVTVDKDALQTQGFLYNPEANKGMAANSVQLIEGLGSMEMKKNKLCFSGRMVFYCQSSVLGDKVDNYDPFYLYKQLKGIKKASHMYTDLQCYNLLKDCNTDRSVLRVLNNLWQDAYGDIKGWHDWKGNWVEGDYIDLWQMYWDLAHMLRWKGDKPDLRDTLGRLL